MNGMRFGRQKMVQGIVLLALIFGVIAYFLLCTPVSPLGADLRAAPSGIKTAADGFWGTLGFYRDPVDNNNTYFLMLLFFTLAIYKTVRVSFFAEKKAQARAGGVLGRLNGFFSGGSKAAGGLRGR